MRHTIDLLNSGLISKAEAHKAIDLENMGSDTTTYALGYNGREFTLIRNGREVC